MSLSNVHAQAACEGRECIIHSPTDHHMREWHLLWRNDTGLFERVCTHGVGHPDPDQFVYWREINAEHKMIHGCDGCCWTESDEQEA